MPSSQSATTIRLTAEDRKIIDKLRKKTGLDSATAIIRMSLRETLASREGSEPTKSMLQKLERLAATIKADARRKGGAP